MRHRTSGRPRAAWFAALIILFTLAPVAAPARAADQPAAPTAAAAAAQDLRVVTYNLDFGRKDRAVVRADLAGVMDGSDVILLQEANVFSIRALVDEMDRSDRWYVRQNTDSDVLRHPAILVRAGQVRSIDSFELVYGVRSTTETCSLGTRYIAKVRVETVNGTTLWLATAHLPPGRCPDSVYDEMMGNVIDQLNRHAGSMILGADWNKIIADNPDSIRQRTDDRYQIRSPERCMDQTKRCIDGLMIPRRFDAGAAIIVQPGNRTHEPIKSVVTVAPAG